MNAKVVDMRIWELRKARPPGFSPDTWDTILMEASKSNDEIMRSVIRRSFFRKDYKK